MNTEKYAWIKDYLTENFPDCEITQKHDFDFRAQSFKVHLADDSLLLKVSDDFANDNNEILIIAVLRRWDVAGLLRQDNQRIVLLTNEGPVFHPRQ